MPSTMSVQYVSDEAGKPVGVLVPLKLWKRLASERETAYLLKSPVMKKRLLDAKRRKQSLSMGEVRAKLGV